MKKMSYCILLSFLATTQAMAAVTSSVVTLSGGGNVAPMTSVSLSLNGLMSSSTYSVVCYITTSYPFQYVMLSSSLSAPTSAILSYSLNGNYVTQDQLTVGTNLVVVKGHFGAPATESLVFTNLDQSNLFNVNNCFAIPLQVS